MGSITTGRVVIASILLSLAGCAGAYVSPLSPAPYRTEIPASYDATWSAIVRAFARANVPLRAIARDSGVIASDEFVTPIGLYADCGRIGDDVLEGEALVSFTLFAQPNGSTTSVQINSKMRTQAQRKGSSGKLKPTPVYICASTARFEANLLDTVRELVRE
ncbi:MAG: hypothetical protein ACREJG_02630 [Candidatus Rokuibacteriota bacterium]